MALLTIALLLDRLIGDPQWLWQRVAHPVVWFGAIIDMFERLRKPHAKPVTDFAWGLLLLATFIALSIAFGWLLFVLPTMLTWCIELVVVVVLIAQKSLRDHVLAVADALDRGIEEGRRAVAMIVGRDVSDLDENGVVRAAIESLAENTSDGVVAPVFWYVVGGAPGIIFYKMVNTADSMIGHRTPHHEWFGKPAAVLDDWMNFLPARLTALLIWMLSQPFSIGADIRMNRIMRDAPQHRSPNAGWPETAFAVALGLALGGPRRYGQDQVDGAWLHSEGRKTLSVADLRQALRLFALFCTALWAMAFAAAIFDFFLV